MLLKILLSLALQKLSLWWYSRHHNRPKDDWLGLILESKHILTKIFSPEVVRMSTVNTDSVSGALGSLSPLTFTFSSSFAQPLKAALPKTYSPGYSGRSFHENDNFLSLRSPLKSVHLRSPRAFFNSILINGDKQLKDCSAKPFKSIDGSPCAYMDVSLALSDSNISAFNNRIL